MADVYLSQRDIDYISRVVATEVPGYLADTDPEEYSRMVGAVVDTITNRMASGEFPSTVEGVVNEPGQFSKINGPVRGAYGSVQNAPKASAELQSMVAGHIADISQGVTESEIGGSVNYANPNFSSAKSLKAWVNPMIEAGAVKLGIGDNVHFHGVIPGDEPVGPYSLSAEGIPTTADVPAPTKNPAAIPTSNPAFFAASPLDQVDPNMALAVPDAISNLPAPDLATAQSFEKAAPATNPWGGAPQPSVQAKGLFAGTAPMEAATSIQNNGVMPGLQADGFSQMASAGPFGGDYTAPEDRFAPQPSVAAPQISQADVDRGLFNVTADGQMDPSFTEAMMGPQNPVVPTSVATTSYEPITVTDNSRFTTVTEAAPKTDRIGQPVAFDAARMPGLVDPSTETTSFMGVPQAPADVASLSDGYEAQRGPSKGIFSAESQAQLGHVYNESLKAEAARQAALAEKAAQETAASALETPTSAVNTGIPGLATSTAPAPDKGLFAAPTNFNQALNPSVPALASTPVDPNAAQMAEIDQASQIPGVIAAKTAPAAITAYADEPATPPAVAAIEAQTAVPSQATSSALLSPTSIASMRPALTPAVSKGLFSVPVDQVNQVGFVNELSPNPDINLSGNIVPGAPTEVAPDLETISVPDQPTITKTQVDIPGPLSTATDQQQVATQQTTAAKTTPQSTTAKRGFWDSLVSPQTAIGATIGGLAAGPIGGFLGAAIGQQVAANPGMFANEPMQINNIGSGYDNVASIWGGGTAPGTQATASDGQLVTSMPGGNIALTNPAGVTTVFDKTGKAMSYFGSGLGPGGDAPTPGGYGASGGYAPG